MDIPIDIPIDILKVLYEMCVLVPAILMAMLFGIAKFNQVSVPRLWRIFQIVSWITLFFIGISFVSGVSGVSVGTSVKHATGYIVTTPFGLTLALLVQLLGTVIGTFSARYLQGETGQKRYVSALAAVLGSVHMLLIADHWLLLIVAWACVGIALQPLLCFYSDRPFALLAAHKKYLADRLADVLLGVAAVLAWREVGSGSLTDLWTYIAYHGVSMPLQISALALVCAAVLRAALLPVHGWLIQVMEAPTPVSALLHAGVVNLSGFVLIRFAPMLEQAGSARIVLLVCGLATAVLAGLVMLTRISIKVRLAWSTVAQMGFMLAECALGLYTLAALHLMGHSLYKAHTFLSASSVVRQTRLQTLHNAAYPSLVSLVLAPLSAMFTVMVMSNVIHPTAWPWWWSVVLGLAWAPLLWLPTQQTDWLIRFVQILSGLLMVAGLTLAAMVAHVLPLGIHDAVNHHLGLIAMSAMAGLYCCQVLLQRCPELLSGWRRWSYAGFYVDEAYTRLALKVWPTQWASSSVKDVK